MPLNPTPKWEKEKGGKKENRDESEWENGGNVPTALGKQLEAL